MSYLFPTYARWNITVKEAKGSWVTDIHDKKYLDFVSGIAVCNLGHANDDVMAAVQEQLSKYWHMSNLFHQPIQEEVAKLLIEHSDGDAVFFCNSGAEANEAAIKLARKHTGKTNIVTFLQSFHGRTFATMSATGQEKIQQGFGPLLETFTYLPYNDTEALDHLGTDVAAIMLEVVQGEGGVIPAQQEFIQKVTETCKRIGALLIIDEVQTGIGRTGKPFAYQHYGISPDIITSAKGLGNGIPVGAMIGKSSLISTFQAGSHGSTFGGNPIAMAAAKATMTKILNNEFLNEVEEKSNYLIEKLYNIIGNHPKIKNIRGKGLLIGIECNEQVSEMIDQLRENNLLVLSAGPNVIRLLPPLTVSTKEIDEAVEIMNQTFAENKQSIIAH
ncbi:acetylornithine transaminase [Metabacillus sediminilitoris]|uniref:Acetylornithine aminotransferase n=1 Tax=Metabacillus sediminilitoris TaxID=2567941 RepID=A0A4S4BV57_9BACI|nr:acetylornithine transaminase [Metabacillus sediminilitoris]QGQ44645.1 acetylornithine transaminase [Metabacillus sediminilitoris]THF79006.1 acetylornithine transaminase [Metabacillus sediminilitoris]